jgi:hypothetical protein
MPTVSQGGPYFPIILPITGEFLALAAPATSPTPLATGRIALRQGESLRQHVVITRHVREVLRLRTAVVSGNEMARRLNLAPSHR